MADRCTRIRLPGVPGLIERGVRDREDMVRRFRLSVEQEYNEAFLRWERVMAADDGDFEVHIVDGVVVNHYVRDAE